MVKTQTLTVLNLDKVVEDVVEVGEDTIEDISYERLERKIMSDTVAVFFNHDYYFALFKLIAEKPEKAIKLLERAVYNQSRDIKGYRRLYEAQEGRRETVGQAKRLLFRDFASRYKEGPVVTSWHSADLFSIVKSNPNKALDFFQECYEEMMKNKGYKLDWEKYEPKILTVLEALKTRNFSRRGKPTHLELRLVPKKEKIEVPKDINVEDYAELSKYLMSQEGSSLENIGIIGNKAILIPREGNDNWAKGVYTITYNSTGETNTIYKTEKSHTDEELVKKTTGKGEVIRAGKSKGIPGWSKEKEIIPWPKEFLG